MDQQHVTDAELAEHYARTGLARMGIGLDEALRRDYIRAALTGAIKAARRQAARQAHPAIEHQLKEAA